MKDGLIKKFERKECKLYYYCSLFLFSWMSIQYYFNMTQITPWYDELYTYQHFICKGPLFTATHWPLPNNHILYNVLSSCVHILPVSSIISLRIVSYISYIITGAVLYIWMNRDYDCKSALVALFFYTINSYTQTYAIQGRGYSLSVLFFLISMICCVRIIKGEKNKWYLLWSITIALAVYNIPSNLYWVVLLFFATVIYGRKKCGKIIKLGISSMLGASIAFVLYLPIWITLAKIDKQADKGVINSIIYGIQSMISSKFIQGIERSQVIKGLFGWVRGMGDAIMDGFGIFILVVLSVSYMLIIIYRRKNIENADDLKVPDLAFFCLIGIVPIIVFQSVLPYTRVLCYVGIVTSVLLSIFYQKFILNSKTKYRKFAILFMAVCVFIGMETFINKQNKKVFEGESDNELKYIFTRLLTEKTRKVRFGDDVVSLNYSFYWYEDGRMDSDSEYDVAIFTRNQIDPNGGRIWSNYYNYNSIEWDYINEEMKEKYKGTNYIVYARK